MKVKHIVLPVALLAMLFGAAVTAMAAAGEGEETGQGIKEIVETIDEEKPLMIMVGSSMQGEGIDFSSLSKQIGGKVTDLRAGGAMSPYQYCVLRFAIPQTKHRAKYVILVDRLNYIVCPQKRMALKTYQKEVNSVAGADRSLLDALAFKGEGQPAWDRKWDNGEPPTDGYFWDFPKAIKTSFLPAMIELAKEGGYQLIYVRHKSRIYAEKPDWETPEVKKYDEDLAAYLQANRVIFLDYVHRPELTADLYAVGDHLNREAGRTIWTNLMAKDLQAVLAGKQAPNQPPPNGSQKPAGSN